MAESLLNKIPKDIVEHMKLYRLGVFDNSSFELVELEAEEDYPLHYHKNSEAEFYMILGEGFIIIGDKKDEYKPGSKFLIPKGVRHGFVPKTQTLLLSIQTPPIKNRKTGKEDIHF